MCAMGASAAKKYIFSSWELGNMAALARLAKKVGFEGVLTDFEDYWKKKQFKWQEGDPEWESAKALARRRGAGAHP